MNYLQINAACFRCGVEFHRPKSQLKGNHKFCSRKCFIANGGTSALFVLTKRFAECHPEKKYYSGGMCRSCYRRIRKLHGLSLTQYTSLLSSQHGRCAICRSPDKLVIDHCHDTGKVRGIICFSCNVGIGSLGDNPDRVARALEYLLT